MGSIDALPHAGLDSGGEKTHQHSLGIRRRKGPNSRVIAFEIRPLDQSKPDTLLLYINLHSDLLGGGEILLKKKIVALYEPNS